jgi:phospholipase C
VKLAQQTADDVSLLWLADQKQTKVAVNSLKHFVATGTIDVYNQGVKSTVPASQVIDKIISGEDLRDFQLGNPRKDSTTPDIVVTLKPGFIFVGNPLKYQFKRAEHGGFVADDTHVALIVGSGGLTQKVQGSVVDDHVQTTQIAVSALEALGLDPKKLQGARAEGTKELPGVKLDDVVKQRAQGHKALQKIDHFVVIYQENWSFDSLYGLFPGANGISKATDTQGNLLPPYQQVDKNGNPITTLPNPSTDPSVPQVAGIPAKPYDLADYMVNPSDKTGDIVHRYYHEQLQIGNGALQPGSDRNQKFVTWSDNQSLVLSYFDATNLPEGKLAQQYTLDDNFFHAAYGGSFLNHQFLAAAAAPQWQQPIPAGFQSSWDPTTQTLNDGNLTIDGKYVVNTTFGAQAPHPTGVPANKLLQPINDVDPSQPGYTPTIGDRLDTAGLDWKWYSGGWTNALSGNADPLFQFHHQPFAYYAKYAPLNPDGSQNPQTSSLLNPNAHLQDEQRFLSDAAAGTLPAVSFVKPLGPDNEHPGYTDLLQGQEHVAQLVQAVQNSPDWAHTAIIITYDENGGRWDHVTPPDANGIWGDGTRVPAIVISPYARQDYVDHTQHDTLSILKTIEERFGLSPLNNLDAHASDLVSNFQLRGHGDDGEHGDDGNHGQAAHNSTVATSHASIGAAFASPVSKSSASVSHQVTLAGSQGAISARPQVAGTLVVHGAPEVIHRRAATRASAADSTGDGMSDLLKSVVATVG